MRRARAHPLVASASLVLLAGCGGASDDPDPAVGDEPATDESPDDTTSTTPDDEPDIDGSELDAGAGTEDLDADGAERRAEQLLGESIDEAERIADEEGFDLRIGRLDGADRMTTEDWVPGRATVSVRDDEVTEVTIEHDGGPTTYPADAS